MSLYLTYLTFKFSYTNVIHYNLFYHSKAYQNNKKMVKQMEIAFMVYYFFSSHVYVWWLFHGNNWKDRKTLLLLFSFFLFFFFRKCSPDLFISSVLAVVEPGRDLCLVVWCQALSQFCRSPIGWGYLGRPRSHWWLVFFRSLSEIFSMLVSQSTVIAYFDYKIRNDEILLKLHARF